MHTSTISVIFLYVCNEMIYSLPGSQFVGEYLYNLCRAQSPLLLKCIINQCANLKSLQYLMVLWDKSDL